MPLTISAGAGAAFVKHIGILPRIVRWATRPGFTESGSAESGYSVTQSGGLYSKCIGASHRVPASTDGYLQVGLPNLEAGSLPIFYCSVVNDSAGNDAVTTVWGVYPGSGVYKMVEGGSGNITANIVAARAVAEGDLLRIRRIGASGVCEVSSDSGTTWTAIHAYTNATAAALYPALEAYSNTTGMVVGPLLGGVAEAV